MVTLLNIPGEDYVFMVDSTNPSIGVLLNGKIYMLKWVTVY